MRKPIIGIDCGLGGGIAVWRKDHATAIAMPDTVNKMQEFLLSIKEAYGDPLIFIEKVQAWAGGDDVPGKKFAINKMLANYEQILTVIKLSGLKYVEVFAATWQSTLGLRMPKDKRTKAERKASYKHYAQNCFPECSVTLKTSDALCILQFGFYKISNDMDWICERVKNGVIKDRNSFF